MQRRRVSKKGMIITEDNFELEQSYTSESVCILCHGGQDMGKELHAALHSSSCDILDSSSDEDDKSKNRARSVVTDPQHIWMSRHPLKVTSNRNDYVHFYCALYSPMSWLHNGKRWCNVAQEVRRSFHFTCALCGLKGATLGCMNSKCYYCVHLPCALQEGWNPSLVNKCSYQCPAHLSMDKDRRNELNQLELHDISLGREAVEVTAELSHIHDIMSLPYIYTAKNLDSDDTQSDVVDVHTMLHCQCTGSDCPSIPKSGKDATCMCCRDQYVRMGPFRGLNLANTIESAFETATTPLDTIFECGLRCQCSSRCINRLVGKGLQFQLQVVLRSHNQEDEILSRATKASRLDRTAERTRDSQPAEMQRREEWGLVALEDVPAGAFICEWAGQYVLGDTKCAIPTSIIISESMMGRGDMDPEPLYSIFESIQTGGSGCSGCDGLGRIVPADMWESPFAIDDFSNWVCYQVHKTSEGKLDTFLEKSIKKRKLPPGDNYESKAVPFKFDDRISDYLKDLIYVDSRYYSNVSRFITLTVDRAESNLCRRKVYIDDDGSKLYPRLAIFANQFIPAGTLLVLH